MNVVGLYVAIVGAGLFLLSLGVFAVARLRVVPQHPDKPDEYSVAAIVARVTRERAAEAFARAPTELLPVISPDDVPTQPLPAYVPLPRRRRPYVERRPTPWPRQDLDQRPEPELMQRVLDRLKRLE